MRALPVAAKRPNIPWEPTPASRRSSCWTDLAEAGMTSKPSAVELYVLWAQRQILAKAGR